MKKKIIFLFTLFFINIFMVQAEEYNCQYYLKEGIGAGWWGADNTHNFRYIVNTDKKTIRSIWVPGDETSDGDGETGEFNAIADTAMNSRFDEEFYVNKLDGKCQSTVYVCKYTSGLYTRYTLLFNDSYQNELMSIKPVFTAIDFNDEWYKMYKNKTVCEEDENNNCSAEYDFDLCQRFYYYDGSGENDYPNKGESVDISYNCDVISNDKKDGLLDKVVQNSIEYKNCKDGKTSNCKLALIAEDYNNNLEQLKSYCKSVIKNQNYGDSCMGSCLGLQDTLKEKDVLIDDLNNKRECYLTEDIVSMIYNVLKWAKYIAPILVIILSILDFIKAIAAQNDDDMKKAQGKFVKRLIVAALLFLLPLIINFMLKTFGLYNSACDISNLFS